MSLDSVRLSPLAIVRTVRRARICAGGSHGEHVMRSSAKPDGPLTLTRMVPLPAAVAVTGTRHGTALLGAQSQFLRCTGCRRP